MKERRKENQKKRRGSNGPGQRGYKERKKGKRRGRGVRRRRGKRKEEKMGVRDWVFERM